MHEDGLKGKTIHGTPVHVQLLGSEPDLMAGNAVKAVELGALAIDINFGCPAKTVNSHRGGSVLLTEPETCIKSSMQYAKPCHRIRLYQQN